MTKSLAGRLARAITKTHNIEATPFEVPNLDDQWVVATREFGVFIKPPPRIDPKRTEYPDHTVPVKEPASATRP